MLLLRLGAGWLLLICWSIGVEYLCACASKRVFDDGRPFGGGHSVRDGMRLQSWLWFDCVFVGGGGLRGVVLHCGFVVSGWSFWSDVMVGWDVGILGVDRGWG